MEFDDVLKRRRMVRNFDDRPLPPAVVVRLLAATQRGPSAGFTQGFELLVLEGQAETARYWDAALPASDRTGFGWPGLFRAPLIVVLFAHEQAYVDRYAEADKARRVVRATHGGVDGVPATQAVDGVPATQAWPAPYWIVDTAFAAMLGLLAAVDEGLGALFFGVFRPDEVRGAFGVPAGYQPVGAIAAGYPLPDEPSASLRRGRRPPEQIIHRGRW